LKPLSQNSPGVPPARARTAIRRPSAPAPTVTKSGAAAPSVALVMDSFSVNAIRAALSLA
jgi:hypothetical protein